MIYWISALFATSSTHPALYAVSVRAVGISPRTSFPTVRCLPAVDSKPSHGSSPFGRVPSGTRLVHLQVFSGLVLQGSGSVSSRFPRCFHPGSHIASAVHLNASVMIIHHGGVIYKQEFCCYSAFFCCLRYSFTASHDEGGM